MENIESKINFLKNNLKEVVSYLDNITEENFDESILQIENCLKDFEIVRNELKESHKESDLKKYNENFTLLIKEIQKRFDSRLQENKFIQKDIVKELNKVVNKKKLANYR